MLCRCISQACPNEGASRWIKERRGRSRVKAAISCKAIAEAVGEIPRFARNDSKGFTSPRASAASVAVSRRVVAKARGETPRFARNDIKGFTSPRASAASVAVSRVAVAEAGGRPLASLGVTLTMALYGASVACVRSDINWFTSPRASAASVAVSRKAVAEAGGRPLASLGMTLKGLRHRERAQRAWRSPARSLRRQGGRPLASLGVTLTMALYGASVACVRSDINWFTSPRASAASVAVSRKAVAEAGGRPLASLGVTLTMVLCGARSRFAWGAINLSISYRLP
ncbi:MAG: hypothetical protein KatS3mg045_0138 [Bellilinea sp.]|nr:MAG: hypothetical protein KatS3mg045_0138 [Bellilinea sp.]